MAANWSGRSVGCCNVGHQGADWTDLNNIHGAPEQVSLVIMYSSLTISHYIKDTLPFTAVHSPSVEMISGEKMFSI